MAFRLRTVLLAAGLVAGVVAAPLAAADTPPKNLKYVNGHWTAWDPPATFPEDAKIHIVEPGDTFWALAAANLGNPYLWPQLWEKNQYVLDAHWIYPGDPLVVGVGVAPASPLEPGATGAGTGEGAAPGEATTEDVVGAGGAGAGAPGMGGETGTGEGGGVGLRTAPSGGTRSVPVPLGAEDDIYCSGYIGEEDEAFPYHVVGSEYEVMQPALINEAGEVEGIYGTADTVKVKLTVGDLVYLDGGRAAGLAPGAILTAIEPEQRIVHPVTRDTFGRQYNYRGRVRVLRADEDSAIGEIVQSCDGIRVGFALKTFVPEPVPLARRTPLRPVNDPTSEAALEGAPVILSHPERVVTLGQDHVVFIDKGEDDDVLPGDLFTIYRTNKASRPPVVIGELAILSVQRHSAVAKILESRVAVYVGDRLERK